MAAQTVPARAITLEEFEAKFAGKRYEYVSGRAVPMGPEITMPNGEVVVAATKSEHGLLVGKIHVAVSVFATEHQLGETFGAETGFVMRQDTHDIRAADVAFISTERMSAVRRGEWLPFPPDLVVEVISQYDTARDIRDKAEDYMENGTRLLWIVYPERRIIDVHRPGQPVVKLGVDDQLDSGDVLPGFSIPVRDIFSPLDSLTG
jgi:Uma2 family endonuclease